MSNAAKVGVVLDPAELQWATQRAHRDGVSLSALFVDAPRKARCQDATRAREEAWWTFFDWATQGRGLASNVIEAASQELGERRAGVTLDAGAMLALERRDERSLALLTEIRNRGDEITVPALALAAWWRGQREPLDGLLDAFCVEPVGYDLAYLAGAALALRDGPTILDAITMASAAQRCDAVLTASVDTLSKLLPAFACVTLLRV